MLSPTKEISMNLIEISSLPNGQFRAQVIGKCYLFADGPTREAAYGAVCLKYSTSMEAAYREAMHAADNEAFERQKGTYGICVNKKECPHCGGHSLQEIYTFDKGGEQQTVQICPTCART